MADYSKRTKADNKHLSDLTGAKWAHPQASATTTVRSNAGRLLKVVLNTNGGTVTLRNGSEVIGIIAADAPEATYNYGVYCNNNIIVETGATVDCTIVFGD